MLKTPETGEIALGEPRAVIPVTGPAVVAVPLNVELLKTPGPRILEFGVPEVTPPVTGAAIAVPPLMVELLEMPGLDGLALGLPDKMTDALPVTGPTVAAAPRVELVNIPLAGIELGPVLPVPVTGVGVERPAFDVVELLETGLSSMLEADMLVPAVVLVVMPAPVKDELLKIPVAATFWLVDPEGETKPVPVTGPAVAAAPLAILELLNEPCDEVTLLDGPEIELDPVPATPPLKVKLGKIPLLEGLVSGGPEALGPEEDAGMA